MSGKIIKKRNRKTKKVIKGYINKKIVIIILLIIILTGALTVLLKQRNPIYPGQIQNPPEIIKTDDSESTQQGIQEVVNANNHFAFDLYSELKKSERGNIFYSPYSISAAMAMTYEGARGQTADEMKSVFHFPEYNNLRPNFAVLYNDLNTGLGDYELSTGNALWVQKDYPFLPEYISRVEKYYGGKASNVDFISETEKSRQTINNFIEEHTNQKIKDLLPAGSIDALTRLVLTNAIYFKGTWQWEFDTSDTRDEDFKITPDNIVKVKMMNMDPEKARFNYAATDDLQILELPYKGDKLSMLILLPKSDLASIESSLTAEKINEYKSQMRETKMDAIAIPKFKFDTKYTINDTLKAMGMPTPFDGDNADFSSMDGSKRLFISFVIHQAFINVDEKGTEAAAATAVGISLQSAVLPSNIFRADHPFIFLIQEKKTGNILFLGKVVDPS